MKDLGFQPRVFDAARDLLKSAPASPVRLLVDKLVRLGTALGGFDPAVADVADQLYSNLSRLDLDADGELEEQEVPHAREHDELLQALRENDRDGDGSIVDDVLDAALPPAREASSKPSAPAARPAFLSLGRRVVVITLWSSRGARYAWDKSKAFIKRVRPDAILLHTDPVALANGGGAKLTADIRAECPWLHVGWAFYGDSYGPNPSAIWRRCARAAEAVGVATLMPNCEAAWKRASRGDFRARTANARQGMAALREGGPRVHISFTSFDGPVNIVRPDGQGTWGGHSDFTWAGFESNPDVLDADAPQVYIGASDVGDTGATFEAAVSRFARANLSRQKAVKLGRISSMVEPWTYLQAHSSRPSAICYLAEQRRVAVMWAMPTRIDSRGELGIAAACELARRERTVAEYQAENDLTVDRKVGTEVLHSLGLA